MPQREWTHSSPDGEVETKTCPFCAETIRAAAIKCRYCQSDLSASTAADAAAPAPEAGVHPEPEPPTVTSAPSTRGVGVRRDSRRFRIAAGLVAVVTLALVTLSAWTWWERRELERAAESGRVARAAVTDKVEALLTYRHESFDEDVAAAQEMMTPSFQEQYAPTVDEIRRRALAQQRNQQAEVLAVGLVSAEPDHVRTLVFVNTLSVREDAADEPPTVMQNRVVVDLVRAGDGEGWLVDDLTFPSA